MKLVIFSDLDGTLLDHHTYSWQDAAPALEKLRDRGVPLVLCSSKTRSEMAPLWGELGLSAPFIAENGGGVYAPAGHGLADETWQPAGESWLVNPIGMPIAELRERFQSFKDDFKARGFGDMTDQEVADITGLPLAQAALARLREFNEPVLLPDPQAQADDFMAAARDAGLQATRGGRFFHLLGGGDKGKAVNLVSDLYRRAEPGLITAALGDAPNDLAMFQAVDRPIQVAKHDASLAELDAPNLKRVPLPGPQGWNQAVLDLLEELS